MSKQKFIYFDVGGVLLLDYSDTNKWTEMKRDLGIGEDLDQSFEDLWDKHNSQICIDFEIDNLIPEINNLSKKKIPENYSLLDDFLSRFEKNSSIWKIVKKAKEKYKIGLLTNMYPKMLPKIIEKGLLPNIEWDVIIDSSLAGCKKPQNEIFKLAEDKSGFKKEEIFFVDNTQKHLNSAKNRGWKTMLYKPTNVEESNLKLQKELNLISGVVPI